jgi:hypothetical protein
MQLLKNCIFNIYNIKVYITYNIMINVLNELLESMDKIKITLYAYRHTISKI